MSRRKLQRFAQNEEAPNIIQDGKPLYHSIKGHWHEEFFKNPHPIVAELACGRGEYTVGLAPHYPHKNFVGVDIKGSRLWKGSQTALAKGLHNVGFLRTYIQNLEAFFAPEEISEIWLIHPDPRPKDGDERRRLTAPRFLEMYRRLMPAEGYLHLKTDNQGLFDYTLESLQAFGVRDLEYTYRLYESPLNAAHHGIETHYERLFREQGHNIHYLRCKLLR